ncbi:MAG: hypothetical protein ACYTEQ_09360, partial [Planctomycetota bacterium]
MTLALYDPDLSQYAHRDLVKAYNESVMAVPSAHRNSPILKNLMVRNLESGGVKDMFELSQEVALGKALEQQEALRG